MEAQASCDFSRSARGVSFNRGAQMPSDAASTGSVTVCFGEITGGPRHSSALKGGANRQLALEYQPSQQQQKEGCVPHRPGSAMHPSYQAVGTTEAQGKGGVFEMRQSRVEQTQSLGQAR